MTLFERLTPRCVATLIEPQQTFQPAPVPFSNGPTRVSQPCQLESPWPNRGGQLAPVETPLCRRPPPRPPPPRKKKKPGPPPLGGVGGGVVGNKKKTPPKKKKKPRRQRVAVEASEPGLVGAYRVWSARGASGHQEGICPNNPPKSSMAAPVRLWCSSQRAHNSANSSADGLAAKDEQLSVSDFVDSWRCILRVSSNQSPAAEKHHGPSHVPVAAWLPPPAGRQERDQAH